MVLKPACCLAAIASLLALGTIAGQGGRTAPGWYGLSLQARMNANAPVVIQDVFPDGPAERAGLAPGDTIVRIAGLPAAEAVQARRLEGTRVGDSVKVVAIHGVKAFASTLHALPRPALDRGEGSPKVVVVHLDSVRLMAREYLDAARRRITVVAPEGFHIEQTDSTLILRNDARNLRVRLDSLISRGRTITDSASDTLGAIRVVRAEPLRVAGMVVATVPGAANDSVKGVVVASVDNGSRFERAGVRPLDVITSVDGTSVRAADALKRLIDIAGGRSVKMKLRRQSRPVELTVPPEER